MKLKPACNIKAITHTKHLQRRRTSINRRQAAPEQIVEKFLLCFYIVTNTKHLFRIGQKII